MKIDLTTQDRLQLPQLLPEKGAYLDLLTARHLSRKTEFTPEEMQELNLHNENNRIVWNPEKARSLEVEFTELELSLLQKQIDLLSEAGELPYYMIDLCEKLKG